MLHLARVVGGAFLSYARLAWWGLVAPRITESKPLIVLQAVVLSDSGVLLTVRRDLRGWELPGGTLETGELPEAALRREVYEETGARVEVGRHVGDYVRTGFRPHTARVYLCRYLGGRLRGSMETRAWRWFQPDAPPDTLFPWYRGPLSDALCDTPSGVREPVVRHEHQGVAAIAAGLRIDLRMRHSDDRAGLRAGEQSC